MKCQRIWVSLHEVSMDRNKDKPSGHPFGTSRTPFTLLLTSPVPRGVRKCRYRSRGTPRPSSWRPRRDRTFSFGHPGRLLKCPVTQTGLQEQERPSLPRPVRISLVKGEGRDLQRKVWGIGPGVLRDLNGGLQGVTAVTGTWTSVEECQMSLGIRTSVGQKSWWYSLQCDP